MRRADRLGRSRREPGQPAGRAGLPGRHAREGSPHMTGLAGLECRGLSAGYERLVVVRELNLAVQRKEILAVLGPNGAGKTTLMLTLAGFLAPAGGTIMIDRTQVPRRSGQPVDRSR